MNNSWKRFLSLLLTLAMILSLGVTGFAEEEDAENSPARTGEETLAETGEETPASAQEDVPEGQALEMKDLDPDDLQVPKLGLEEDRDLGEIVPMDGEDLNTVVRASIFLDAPSTLAAGYSAKGVGTNGAAVGYRDGLLAGQKAMTARIEGVIGHELNVYWNLTLAANAISADLSLAEMVKVQAIPGVRSVVRENRYLPMGDGETADPNTANTSEYMVGATDAWAVHYTGAGSRIAIIDTGIDTTHQSFADAGFNHAIEETGTADELMTVSDINAVLSQLNAKQRVSSLTASQLNGGRSKIVYGFNYIDGNTTIDHLGDTQGEHGSHVAGIAAANRYIKNGSGWNDAASSVFAVGMAPDAQLLVMKVFGATRGGGAYDSDYMVAIEDAIVLGADACNLSLGSGYPGFTFAGGYQEILNNLADPSKNPDMVVSISAGNASDLAAELDQGSLYREDVSMHTGGNPGSFVNSLCVASADNVGAVGAPLTFNGSQNVFYTDGAGSMPGIAGSYSYVYIDAVGEAADYSAVNSALSLSGKIVIVNRGGLSFVEKGNNAKSYNPKALIVANNQPGTVTMGLDGYTGSFPVVSITQLDADTIKANGTSHTTGGYTYYTGTVTVSNVVISEASVKREDALISDFSSWGVPGSLIMKPEITAPGGNIYSVFGTNKTSSGTAGGSDQYELMSGTSMAAPHIAGLSAVLAEYLREDNPANHNDDLKGYSTRAISQSLMMSTATVMAPGGEYLSILQQGAGLVNVYDAINSGSVIMMDPSNSGLTGRTGAAADGKVKVELGDDPAREGDYSFGFTVFNLTDEDVHYNVSTDVFTQALDGEFMSRGTDMLGASATCWWAPMNGTSIPNLHDVNRDGRTDSEDATAILDYVSGEKDESELDLAVADLDEDEMISSLDAYLLLGYLEQQEGELPSGVVPAHSSRYCAVRITLPDAVKANLNESYPGGAYIEGFTYVRSDSETKDGAVQNDLHSIPILGFYGSWTDAAMFDTTSYVEKLYGSDQEAYTGNDPTNYVTLLQNGKTVKFSGNPYTVEESFPADKLALNSNTTVQSITYNLIRSAGTTAFAVSKLDEEGLVTEVPAVSKVGYDATGIWYSPSKAVWQNLGSKTYSVNKTPASYGLAEGDRFRLGFYAIPEYNAMLVNNSYNAANSGNLNETGLDTLLKSNTLGKGAFIGYDFVVDDTAPEIKSAVLNGNQLTIAAADDRALAYVAVMSLNGSVVYAEAVPGTNTYNLSFDATDAIENAYSYVAVFAGDYAGNESSKAVKVNDKQGSAEEIYVLTTEPTAGKEYLILDRNTAGTGHALSFTLSGSKATVSASSVTVKNEGGMIFVSSSGLPDQSKWTGRSGSTSGTWTFDSQGWYLRHNNTSLAITKDTGNRDWNWDDSNNRLSYEYSNWLSTRTYYLRYASSNFSVSTSTNSVYLYERQETDGYLDPNAVESVTLDNYSLTLHKGNTVRLSAQVLPLTVEDQSFTWSSSDPNIAAVDETGLITAVWTGSETTDRAEAIIRATSNADSSKYAECTVKVMAVGKTLNAVIWDEAGEVFFSEFNARNLPAWTKMHDVGQPVALHSTVYQYGTLFALSLDGETSTAYSVSSSFGLTELGNFSYPASDLAPGPNSVTLNDGTKLNLVIQAYGPYLLVSEVLNLDDEGNAYGGQAMIDEDTYIAGVAAITVTKYGGTYYFLDETGKIWKTELTLNGGFSFSDPTLVVDTGISTSFTYQSLYYDGSYLYWSHQEDNLSELIIIVPSTGEVVHAGNFGDNVWPAAGLYVKNAVAPAGVDDSADGVLIPMDMSFIDSERINARYMAQLYGASLPEEDEAELPADESGTEEEGSIAIVEPAEENEPILEPVPAEDGQDSAYSGSLMAFRGYRGAAPTAPAAETQAEDEGVITLEIAQRLASHNGLIAVDFDPALVSFQGAEDCESASNLSVHYDEKGVVSIAYANKSESGDEIAADVPIVKLRFAVADESALQCGELANITTLERGDQLELDEQIDVTLPGSSGHDWGEPTWIWAEDFSDAEANFVCRNNPAHTATVVAEVSSETLDGVTTYTATAQFQGKTYTDTRTDGKPPAAIIKSTTVMFDGKIHLRFSFVVPQEFLDLEGAYVSFSVKDAEVQRTLIADGAAGDNGVTMFYLPVLIPEFADMVTVTFHDADGKVLRIENSRGEDYTYRVIYSAKTYAERMMVNGKTEKDRRIAKGLYDYGTAAQIYFQYGEWEDLVLDSAVTSLTRADLADYAPKTNGTKPEGFKSGGMRLYFEADNTLRISFKLDGTHPASDYNFTLDGKTIEVKSNGSLECYYDIKNIPGPELSRMHQFSISNGTDTYSLTISALGYAYNLAGHADVNEQNLGKALYLYALATEAYFA